MFPLAAKELAYHNRHHTDTTPAYLSAVEGVSISQHVEHWGAAASAMVLSAVEGLVCRILSSPGPWGLAQLHKLKRESGIRINGRPVRVCWDFMTALPGRMTYDVKPSLTLTVHERAMVNHCTQDSSETWWHAGLCSKAAPSSLFDPRDVH